MEGLVITVFFIFIVGICIVIKDASKHAGEAS
ncbi:hypothetical protein MHK_003013 [Candidatus Magnetomorum sp. HK-1]|nr:hypothetical protein MHK_003013 [Candidatus Magnetomorum sp. HK-1]